MQVSFVDITKNYPDIRDNIHRKFEDIIDTAHFVGSANGKYTQMFESQFAHFCGAKHAITVKNGTAALEIILRAMDIGAGDEVIVPVNTFIATVEAIAAVGAQIVFADIDDQTYVIDVDAVKARITERTRAIIPVHLYGQLAPMHDLLSIASQHGIRVIEDACQAHGAEDDSKRAGSFGDAAAFSFYPGKNLGAWGEGGAVITNDDQLAKKISILRDHGSARKYEHELIGGNFRLDEFQSAVLTVKLPYLNTWNEQRRRNAAFYMELLGSNPAVTLPVVKQGMPVWHLFVVRIQNRIELIDYLSKHDIQTGVHYPTPLHLTRACEGLGYHAGDFPIAEKVQSEIVSLPMYPELSKEEIKYVCRTINAFTALMGRKAQARKQT